MSSWFAGEVVKIKYHDPEKNWYVLQMLLKNENSGALSVRGSFQIEDTTSVVGAIIGMTVSVGTYFGFEGDWAHNPKFGDQIKMSLAPAMPGEEDPDYLFEVIATSGVNRNVLSAIRKEADNSGVKFSTMLRDLDTMGEIPGVGSFAAELIRDRYRSHVAVHQSLTFLKDLGFNSYKIKDIAQHFGTATEEILSEDPWKLLEIPGISFQMADNIAVRLGLPRDDIRRKRAAVVHSLQDCRGNGHLYVRASDVVNGVRDIAPDLAEIKSVLRGLLDASSDGEVVVDRETEKGLTAVYEPWCFYVENGAVDFLKERYDACVENPDLIYVKGLSALGPLTQGKVEDFEANTASIEDVTRQAFEEWQALPGRPIVLEGDQISGAIRALTEPISIITGLPGTGKTSLCRSVVQILVDAGVVPLLVAPTGMAAKRLEQATGAPALTVHRAFKAEKPPSREDDEAEATYMGIIRTAGVSAPDNITRVWGYNEDHPHTARVVIIDEASMLDQHLLWRILASTRESCRLVFVGDAEQLPSVGAGDVLRQMIQSGVIPVTNLTKIFRQDEAGDIVKAAHSIHAGRVPAYDVKSEFTLLEVSKEKDVLSTVERVVKKLWEDSQKPNGKGWSYQVISPRHKGTVGVTNLNERLREMINPKKPGVHEVRVRDSVVREGDRVTIVKNDYKRGVFNGDVGKVARIDRAQGEMIIKIHGPISTFVTFPLALAGKYLRLAYAVTVHRAQGQEFDVVVMPIVDGFHYQLQRNLLYTAITRAKEKVILVGHCTALARAVHSNTENQRRTLLASRLRTKFEPKTDPCVSEKKKGDSVENGT